MFDVKAIEQNFLIICQSLSMRENIFGIRNKIDGSSQSLGFRAAIDLKRSP